jgi:hypothetical protein
MQGQPIAVAGGLHRCRSNGGDRHYRHGTLAALVEGCACLKPRDLGLRPGGGNLKRQTVLLRATTRGCRAFRFCGWGHGKDVSLGRFTTQRPRKESPVPSQTL